MVQDGEPRTASRPGRVAAVVVAAGSGTRLGAGVPKALVQVGGEPLVAHAVRRLRAGGVAIVVVAAPGDRLGELARAVGGTTTPGDDDVLVVPGGPSRQASVGNALRAVPRDVDVVLVHDAARCFAPPELVARVVAAVREGHRAVVPVVPVTDTLVVSGDDGPVVGYEDRSRLRAVQTPQGFDRATLALAHTVAARRAGDEASAATDDASLVAAMGATVHAVPGDDAAMKITTPRDLALAEHVLDRGSSS